MNAICGGAIALIVATTAGSMWMEAATPASASGTLLAASMTVQQQMARSDASGAGALFCASASIGQQQTERTSPSYAHWYLDPIAMDGARTNVIRIRTARRTCRHYTRLAATGNVPMSRRERYRVRRHC
jgi:hypothetical protein